MYHTPSKRRKRVQLTFIYMLMVLSIVSIVFVLILVVQGYRYDSYDGKVEQGGLVQFDSRPSGATVSVDDITLSARTASKITLSSGRHTVKMTRDGYNTWQKNVSVTPGGVLWLNYARMLPSELQVSRAAEYEGVADAQASPDAKKILVLPVAQAPSLAVTTINTDTPKTTTLVLPDTLYTHPENGAEQRFAIVEWDKDSRYALLSHSYGDKTEFLSLDTQDLARSKNITTGLGVEAKKIIYSKAGAGTVYIWTTSDELRRADLGAMTLSGPLVERVSDMSMNDDTAVLYATNADEQGVRTVGYVSSGATVAKTVKSYRDAADKTLHYASMVYYGDRYHAIAVNDTIQLYQGSVPGSADTASISLKSIGSMSMIGGATYLGFSPGDHRFVYAAQGQTIATYDLELNAASTQTLPGTLSRDIAWMDGFHILSTTGETGYFYDYDGTNGQQFAKKSLNLPAVMADGDRYLYYFANIDGKTVLDRIRLLRP